jgi:hypothetical protein
MSVTPSPIGGFAAQFFDNNGVILSGGKIYTYAAGTTTPQASYTSASGVTPHSNPIILDSAGRVPGGEIWLTDGLVYKFVIETATGILLGTYDNITGVNSNFVNYTIQEEVITATAGQTVFNLSTINYSPGTNSLTVYIDGVNQYVGDSYLETDSNTVTFTSGVHVGGEVKFTTAIQNTGGAVDASIVSYDPPYTGSVATTVENKLAQYVSVKDFGAVGDGATDDTVAIQAALDVAQPIYFPPGEYLVTDTILLNPGAHMQGAGGVANYAAAATKIKFQPATKRDVFNWRVVPVSNVFEGVVLKGFTIRGFGPGASACLDLPLLYNGAIDFYAFAGIDAWMRLRRWQDCDVKGGVQGFRNFGVEFSGAGIDPSDVTTTTSIDAYIAQGPIGYISTGRAVTDCKISGTIESVDKACDIARGNVLWFDVYTENVPRTDAGSAWEYGITGGGALFETALYLNLRPGVGHTGATINNARLLDVDAVRYVQLSGYAYLYKSLVKTTANTRQLSIISLDTDNIELFSANNDVYDFSKITVLDFNPSTMELQQGTGFFTGAAILPSARWWPRPRTGINFNQLFIDSENNTKLTFRDNYGNYSNPVPFLRTDVTTGWTFQGGMLAPAEIVVASNVNTGSPALWYSTLHSRDTATIIAGGTSTSGSPIVTGAAAAYDGFIVGDWVTASAGFPSASTQYQILAKASNGSSVTLDTNANASVAGTVTLATAAHDLQAIGQQGYRTFAANPVGAVVPKYIGEELLRTDTTQWYKSSGLTSADWKAMT